MSTDFKWAGFNYIHELEISLRVANDCSVSGDCEPMVLDAMKLPEIKAQLDEIDPKKLIQELAEYGAWEENELSNHQDNLIKIVWIACGQISDENV